MHEYNTIRIEDTTRIVLTSYHIVFLLKIMLPSPCMYLRVDISAMVFVTLRQHVLIEQCSHVLGLSLPIIVIVICSH